MSNETVETTSSALAIASEQTSFTPDQVATLAHMGVQDAPEADLRVFFHACKRSGLDPFIRQIYMISRMESFKDEFNNWRKRPKWTIQTGIDGFWLIAHRAAKRDRVSIGSTPIEWCDENGMWRGAWRKAWGYPVAARVAVVRDGQEFPATANFDDYVKYDDRGEPILTSTWKERYPGQLGKCAVALSLRMAYPQDLSGMYSDEEMSGRHDVAVDEQTDQVLPPARGIAAVRAAASHAREAKPAKTDSHELVQGTVVEPEPATLSLEKRRDVTAAFTPAAGFDSDPHSADGVAKRISYMHAVIAQAQGGELPDIKSTADLTEAQADLVIAALTEDAANSGVEKLPEQNFDDK